MIEYVPDLLLFHHHGRRQASQGYNVIRNYLIASGGLYMKYFFKSPALCRMVWWDSRMPCGRRFRARAITCPSSVFPIRN